MPHKGYKQSNEHKSKKSIHLVNFTGVDDPRRLKKGDKVRGDRKKRLSTNVWRSLLKSKFGITEETYNQILIRQGNRCAICGSYQVSKRLAVDHNHSTGKVRGLLCVNCNLGIGSLKEDRQILENAIEYLELHK